MIHKRIESTQKNCKSGYCNLIFFLFELKANEIKMEVDLERFEFFCWRVIFYTNIFCFFGIITIARLKGDQF